MASTNLYICIIFYLSAIILSPFISYFLDKIVDRIVAEIKGE